MFATLIRHLNSVCQSGRYQATVRVSLHGPLKQDLDVTEILFYCWAQPSDPSIPAQSPFRILWCFMLVYFLLNPWATNDFPLSSPTSICNSAFLCMCLSVDFLTTSSEMSAKVMQRGPIRPIDPITFCGEKANSRVTVREGLQRKQKCAWREDKKRLHICCGLLSMFFHYILGNRKL